MRTLSIILSVCWILVSLPIRIPDRIYDCSSSKFSEFPDEVQEECIQQLREELIELILQRMQEESKKKYIEV